ncbi:PEPxxWA-CTERM sorting domain-containing protein [Sphingomonas sp.]|jgi:hypothetical protein|uniref:PEPxxWA-CTERM sorting domain-containing protein n=1 Tax=Sphingomonas sp. TaxID=28214 RepID=UPI002DE91174|nr:PEPxxWA-CTERM sorting domain-containing protein [Sphingomonas sp.]
MQPISFAAAAVAIGVGIAAPAQADIVQVDASAIQGKNILFNAGTQNATTVVGLTNSTPQFSVDITSGGAILRASGGQASVSGALNGATKNPNDTINLTQFQLELTQDGLTFQDVEFRLFGGDATEADFTLIDDAGTVFTFNDQAITGDGRFGFQAINGQTIARVSFTVNGTGIQEVRQIRVGPAIAAIPEPATWAMMLGGFGLLGAAMRRRDRMAITYS